LLIMLRIVAFLPTALSISPHVVSQCDTDGSHVTPMGTIVPRRRRDGTAAYMARIRIKREGKIGHSDDFSLIPPE
jgi:hypothetical protein